jgi:hypothetical protein
MMVTKTRRAATDDVIAESQRTKAAIENAVATLKGATEQCFDDRRLPSVNTAPWWRNLGRPFKF